MEVVSSAQPHVKRLAMGKYVEKTSMAKTKSLIFLFFFTDHQPVSTSGIKIATTAKTIVTKPTNFAATATNEVTVTNEEIMKMFQCLNERVDQVFVCLDEIKTELKTNKESSKKIDRKPNTIDTVVSTIRDSVPLTVDQTYRTDDRVSFEKIKSVDELICFETNLGNVEYFNDVLSFLHASVKREDVNNRLHDTLDLVFDRKFLPECGWKGIRRLGVQKIPLATQENILKLFKTVGTTPFCVCTDSNIESFFTKKTKVCQKSS